MPNSRLLSTLQRLVLLMLTGLATMAEAAPVFYQFDTTVAAVSATAPSPYAGFQVGDAISGLVSFDLSASVATPSPLTLPLGAASHYPLVDASVVFKVKGVTLSSWVGTLTALVFNNDDTLGNGGIHDGLLLFNRATAGNTVFRLGNLLLAPSVFSNEALPAGSLQESLLLQIGPNNSGETYLQSAVFSPLTISRQAPVPLPQGLWLLASAAVLLVKRRQSTA